MKIAIGISNHGDTLCSDFFWNFQAMLTPSNAQIMTFRGDGTFKVQSLNEIVKQALDWQADYIFFMDYDIIFPQDTLMKLISHDLDIVGGLYHTKVPPFAPVSGWTQQKEGKTICVNQNGKVWKYDFAQFPQGNDKGLVEVDWTGIGCLLVKTKIFKDIGWEHKKLYDVFDEKYGIRMYGHDINFCLDAKKAGYKVFIDRTINLGHTMVFAIDESWVSAFYDSGMNIKWIENEKKIKETANYWNRIWSIEGLNTPTRTYPDEFNYIVSTIPEGSRVADVGCGVGKLLYRLKNEKKCDCYGYDFSKIAIDKIKSYGLNGEVQDLLNIDFNDSDACKYDYVICSHVYEHFNEEQRMPILKALKYICKMGGKIFINVPNTKDYDCVCLEHKINFTSESFLKELKQTFSDVKISKIGTSFVAEIQKA